MYNVVPFICIKEASDSSIYTRDSSMEKWFIVIVFMLLELELRLYFFIYFVAPFCEENSFFECQKSLLLAGLTPPQIYFCFSVFYEERKRPPLEPLKHSLLNSCTFSPRGRQESGLCDNTSLSGSITTFRGLLVILIGWGSMSFLNL